MPESPFSCGERGAHMIDFIVALLASALAGTGVGGGGLLVIYLTLAKQIEQLTAQGINLSFFLAGAVSSLLVHVKKRHINFPLVLLLGLTGAAFSFLGFWLAERVASSLLQKAFGAMLILVGIQTLFKKVEK